MWCVPQAHATTAWMTTQSKEKSYKSRQINKEKITNKTALLKTKIQTQTAKNIGKKSYASTYHSAQLLVGNICL